MYALRFTFRDNSIKIDGLLNYLPVNIQFEPQYIEAFDNGIEGDWFTKETFSEIKDLNCKNFSIYDDEPGKNKFAFHFSSIGGADYQEIYWVTDKPDFLEPDFVSFILNNPAFISGHFYLLEDVSWQSQKSLINIKYAPESYKNFNIVLDEKGIPVVDISKNYGRRDVSPR